MQKNRQKLEDLTFSQLQKLPEKELFKLIQQQNKSAILKITNSIELLPHIRKNTPLHGFLNRCLKNLEDAEWDLQCKLEDTNNKK